MTPSEDKHKMKMAKVWSLSKGPLISSLLLLSIVWIVFSFIPEDSGWHFGNHFRLFFSAVIIAGTLFFLLFKARPLSLSLSGWKVPLSVIGLYIVSISLLTGLGHILPQFELPKPVEENAGEEEVSATERGKALFQGSQAGCYLCHSVQGAGGTSGIRAPDLSRIGEIGATRKPGVSLEDYLRESIIDPSAFNVPDYPAIMPTNFGERLSQQQINDLIAYLKSLR